MPTPLPPETLSPETFPPETPQTVCRRGRYLKWILPAGLTLVLLTAAVLYLPIPQGFLAIFLGQHKATALIQVRSVQPAILVKAKPLENYETFLNTQIALIRSPVVLDRVLENAEIAKLPTVLAQKNKQRWLARQLQIERVGNSELVSVSLQLGAAEEAEKIVNAVLDAYFSFIEESERAHSSGLLAELQVEKRRQLAAIENLLESMRAKINSSDVKNEIEIAFMQTQIKRANKVIGAIEERILAIQAEQRAPAQVMWLMRAVTSAAE